MIVYLNGRFVPEEQACVSIHDRGFLYGDSVYETMRVYGEEPFAFAAHLERLKESGRRVGFELPWPADAIAQAVRATIAASRLPDAYARIIATRGSGAVGLDPNLAVDPQLLAMVLPLPPLPEDMYQNGRRAALVSVQRNLVKGLSRKYTGIKDLGHKEALFYVLLGVKMPAILVETSFLSNPEDEERLASGAFQSEVAKAISQGVEDFLDDRNRVAKVD
jgi:N-acetylmuramoyl-L-alanine amidase